MFALQPREVAEPDMHVFTREGWNGIAFCGGNQHGGSRLLHMVNEGPFQTEGLATG